MSDEQTEWLKANPQFKPWRPQGVVSVMKWADVGYLMPYGKFVPEGTFTPGFGGKLMSSGDTLYVMPRGAMKVGREYMIN